MKLQKYTIKGSKTGEFELPKEFNVKVNLPLLAQAVYVYEDRSHIGLRKTKTRSEVNRTSKKVYKQKGTGGARHGSRRANVFVGGGVALGPRPVKRILSLPDDFKNKAKFMALSLKASEKQAVAVSGISKISKTKEAETLLKVLEKEITARRFTFILSEKSKEAARFLRNLKRASCVLYRNVNALDIYKGGAVILDEEIFDGNKTTKDDKAVKTVKKVVKKEVKKTK